MKRGARLNCSPRSVLAPQRSFNEHADEYCDGRMARLIGPAIAKAADRQELSHHRGLLSS